MDAFQQIASDSQLLLQQMHSVQVPPQQSQAGVAQPLADPLHFPAQSIEPDLRESGLSLRIQTRIVMSYNQAVVTMQNVAQNEFDKTLNQLWDVRDIRDGIPAFTSYRQALTSLYLRGVKDSASSLKIAIVNEVHRAKVAAEASLLARASEDSERELGGRNKGENSAEPTSQFTQEVIDCLEAAFELKNVLTKHERKFLASKTGLTERQIGTWVSRSKFSPKSWSNSSRSLI